jgi:hypothetical protein
MAAGPIERPAHDQGAAGIALDQQDDLAVAQQRRQRCRDGFLGVTTGDDDDHVGALDRGGEIGRDPLDRGKTTAFSLNVDAAASPDLAEAAVVEIMQAQFAAEPAEFGGEIDAADAGADDRNRRIGHRDFS